MAPRQRSPDDGLADDNYVELNRAFYAAKPHDYFNQRLENLILVAGKPERLRDLTAAGVTFKGLTIPATSEPESEEAGGRAKETEATKAAEHFVTAECEVLAHHLGESLLRLYLAHEFGAGQAPPPCPWLAISRMRSPGQFKQAVQARFGPQHPPAKPEHLAAVARVFHGSDDPAKLSAEIPSDRWAVSLMNANGYLTYFGQQFLDRAPLYNAAKHGLAVLPTEMSMRYGDGAVVRADGPAIMYLDVRDTDGRPHWYQSVHWVRADQQMALTFRGLQLMASLWDVARLRYTDAEPRGFRLRLFDGPSWFDIKSVAATDTNGVVIEDMAIQLAYYIDGATGDAS